MSTSDPRNRRPEPTRLLLLEHIREQQQGTKIRFLGCIHAYNGKRAILVLKQHFPATTAKVPVVLASIGNILETLDHQLLQTGAWLNVVGYVRKPVRTFTDEYVRRHGETVSRRKPLLVPYLEATLIWSAGAVNVDDYETAARSYQRSLPSAS